jgi:hypothetical protein
MVTEETGRKPRVGGPTPHPSRPAALVVQVLSHQSTVEGTAGLAIAFFAAKLAAPSLLVSKKEGLLTAQDCAAHSEHQVTRTSLLAQALR